MAKQRIFDLAETKGSFQLRGIVSGTKKDTFYSEKKTKNDKLMRKVNFGIEYEKGHTVYITLQGMEQDFVYFSTLDKETEKYVTEKVNWADRVTFNKEGYKIIGINCGLEKIANEQGNMVNDKKSFVDFDACSYISQNLHDGDSIFVKGSIDISSFTDDNGEKKTFLKLTPSQISLCSDPIDFDAENVQLVHEFKMPLVFTGIEKEIDDNGNHTKRFVLSSKVVNYSSIEDYSFIVDETREKFARMLNKKMKPYTYLETFGFIVSTMPVEEVEEDDEWGGKDPFVKPDNKAKMELIIDGANKETVDTEKYAEPLVIKALKAIEENNKAKNKYGKDADDDINDEDWGSADSFDDDEDEPW